MRCYLIAPLTEAITNRQQLYRVSSLAERTRKWHRDGAEEIRFQPVSHSSRRCVIEGEQYKRASSDMAICGWAAWSWADCRLS